MEKKLKQMSFVGVSHASQYQSQENKKEKMMIDSYSQKCLESLKRFNPNGLLVKMCKTLLTSQMEQSSEKLLKGWKMKISKSNVLVFQLVHKELGTKEKESGLLPTPTTDSVSERTKKYKQGGTPLTMAVRQMYPTPNATNINTPQPDRVEQVSSGGFILRKKNKPHMTYGARLQDVMHHLENKKTYPTPRASDHKDISYNTTWKMGKNSQNRCFRSPESEAIAKQACHSWLAKALNSGILE